MATLPTTALGNLNATFSTVDALITGTEPVLELIGSAVDTSYVYDATNSTHTGIAAMALGDVPGDFGTMLTLAIQLRYRLGTSTANKTWDSLTAQVYQSDGTTPLTNAVTIATNITTTTATNSSVVSFTGVDTTSGAAVWNGALVFLRFSATRTKGGNTDDLRVTAAEVTGTYTAGATTETRTASANAALQQTFPRTASATAALQALQTKQALVSASISQTFPRTAEATAYLLGGYSKTANADAAVQGTLTKTSSATGALQQAFSRTAVVTAALLRSWPLTAASDAAVQLQATRLATTDATLQKIVPLTAGASAVLESLASVYTRTADASGALQKAFAVVVSAAASLIGTRYARPNADTSTGPWLSTEASLYEAVDEVAAEDADYIYTTSAGECELPLWPIQDPGINTGHVLKVRVKSPNANAVQVTVMQGVSVIATRLFTGLPTSFTTLSVSLSEGEAALISDYTALSVKLEAKP